MDISYRNKQFKIIPTQLYDSIWEFVDEREVIEKLYIVQEGDVVMDVGSCFGSYTLSALAFGASYVYSIEPNKYFCDALEQNLKANSWQDKCKVLNIGLSYKHETKSLLQSLTEHGVSMRQADNFGNRDFSSVEFYTLDEIAHQHHIEKLNWIKIDTEGAEYDILLGGIESLKKFKPTLLIEDHSSIFDIGQYMSQNKIKEKMLQLLSSLDYKIKEFPFKNRGYILAF